VPRPVRARAGRTPTEQTPLSLRTSGVDVDEATREHVRRSFGTKLGKLAPHIERLTVRLTNVNGPRGGAGIDCDVKVVLNGHRSVVYRTHGRAPREAIDRATPGLVRAVRSALERAERPMAPGAPPRRPRRVERARPAAATPTRLDHPSPEGSLIGRRVGRGAANLALALERPEKARRDAPVDTAAPGRSATHRRAGGGSTARRNAKKAAPRATATLEDSARDRPSRKSTRKSANRSKQGNKLRQRKVREVRSPSARAAKANAR
jgi:ribosome-associated translation inhibitor RaiA